MIRNDSAQCACWGCWGISWYGQTWFVRPVALGTQAELQTRLVSLRSRAATMLKANFQLSQQMSAVASWKTTPYSAAASPENPVSSFTFWSGGERSCNEACKNAAGSSWWWEIDVERKREKCLLFAAVCLQFPRRDIHSTSGNILGTSK